MTLLIVGAGKMGMSHLALATPYVGRAQIAVCERSFFRRLLLRWFGYRVFRNLDRASAELKHLTAVLISTPTSSHAELVSWAISRRIPFFVEKPLTLSVEKSKALVEMQEKFQVISQVGFVLRFVPVFAKLQEALSKGLFGSVSSYRLSMKGNAVTKPLPMGKWQGDASRGGGCLNEYGPHAIDLSHFLFGEISEIAAVNMERVFCPNADDRVTASVVHKTGVRGHLTLDWCDVSKRKSVVELEIDCGLARIFANNSAVNFIWHDVTDRDRLETAETFMRFSQPTVQYYLRGEEFSLQLEEFLRNIFPTNFRPASFRTEVPLLRDGYAVDKVIDVISSSWVQQ